MTRLSRVSRAEASRRPVRRPAPLFPEPDRRPAAFSPTSAVARRGVSHGVDGFFRVYTPGGSSILVCYLGFDLTPHDAVLAVFPPGASRLCCQRQSTPLVNFTSPSEHKANCPPFSAPHHSKCASPPGSSPKVSRPSSASRAKRLLTAGLPHPLRSAFAVSHSLDGLLRFAPFPGIAPGNTHGVSALQGNSRTARATPSPKSPPLMALARQQLLRTVACAASSRCTSRDSLRRFDRNHLLPVSLPQGSDPLMGHSLVGPLPRLRPER